MKAFEMFPKKSKTKKKGKSMFDKSKKVYDIGRNHTYGLTIGMYRPNQ